MPPHPEHHPKPSKVSFIFIRLLVAQRKPPSPPKTPTLPLQPQRLSLASLSPAAVGAPPLKLTEARKPCSSASTPYSLLPLLLPSLPEFEDAFVFLCTKSKELVLLSLFANSVKLSRFTLVELRLCKFSFPTARFPFVLELEEVSFRLGIAVVEIEREGRAREFGRLFLLCCCVTVLVPVRGRSPPELFGGEACPWKADIACWFKNGIGGLLGVGDRGLEFGSGVLLPDI